MRARVAARRWGLAARGQAGERRKPAEELPPRPAGCRKTSRICWWAG
jgi:hypothetical protein